MRLFLLFIYVVCSFVSHANTIRVWELYEITLHAREQYDNPYTDVECWALLEGPDGSQKRVFGFWDGENIFRIRLVANRTGEWTWTTHSSNPNDSGLNGHSGCITATSWSPEELEANPTRKGFIRSAPGGHSLQFADGTPFFFLADTFWAASTWRYPLTGKEGDSSWIPGPENLTFENVIGYRKRQGYNSIAMIACYPNWHDDDFPAQHVDENGIGIRQAWEQFGTETAKPMHDENGSIPFELSNEPPRANFDRLNPSYFQSLDRKMAYLNEHGMIPFLETIRRDHGPGWKANHQWPHSFVRYVQYIVARYGAFNMIFSPIHLDWIPENFSLSGAEFNRAITAWYQKTGGLPFGQPVTTLIDRATHTTLGGHVEEIPWLTMHSVGNSPRHRGVYQLIEEQFQLFPPLPTANLEPYYPGWNHPILNQIEGVVPSPGSELDNYYGRSHAWGSVFSGGLAGHIYGTGAYCGNTVGDAPGHRPYIWEALKYESGSQMLHLKQFLLSESELYQQLYPCSERVEFSHSDSSRHDGLTGSTLMLSTVDKSLALLYFEMKSQIGDLFGFIPHTRYKLNWYDPENGNWLPVFSIESDADGTISLSEFPSKILVSKKDWALKITL